MKSKFLLALLFVIGMTSKGFSQASFIISPNSGCAPLCANFLDQSVGGLSWSWNFGDASAIDTQQNPMHCFFTPGVYNVTLIENFSSGLDTAYGVVTVYPNPIAAFTYTNTGNNTVNFTDQTTGGATMWYWSFGDTSTYVTQQNPTHTYASSGIDTVCLFVVDTHGCSDTLCQTIMVTGLHEINTSVSWSLFPNPSTNGNFTVQFDSPSVKPELLVIENVLGEKIVSEIISGTTTLDLSGNAAGIYFVRLGNGAAQKLLIH